MSADVVDRQQQFARVLQDHLRGGEEASLLSAYELGRAALADGLGVLDLATLLQDAMLSACHRAGSVAECAETVKAAGDFAREALSPFEMAQRAAREANAALRGLNETLEELAKRISRELHDEAGQLLVSVYLALADLARESPPEIAGRLEGMRVLLDRVEGELRRLSHELRPTIVDDLGLVAALTFLADGVSARSGVPVKVETTRDARLPARIEVVLYRVVQEALSNACRHARAASVKIRLHEQGRTICCSVQDDGVGFDVPAVTARRGCARGIGLIGIRERLAPLGGSLTIASAPGLGTELLVTIPLEGSAPARCAA